MTHPTLIKVMRDGITPEITRPGAERLISGDPVHTTWSIEDTGKLFAGLWHSTKGLWRTRYTYWEYVHILEGHSILTDAAGQITHLKAGDSFILRPGFAGTWEVVEPTLKDYVIVA